MIQRLGIGYFLGLLMEHIEDGTGYPCYDSPDNEESPFYSVELVKSTPENTKTMFVDAYEVWVHCISERTDPYSNAPVLRLVEALERAMCEEVTLPDPFALYRQVYNGVQTLKRDESNEGHAILSFDFRICYGFRCK